MGRVCDAAVLGAGPAGGAMACVLAGMGWDTVLIDRGKFPRHKVCGEFLSPESRDILQRLGLESLIPSPESARMDRVRLVPAGGTALEVPLPGTAFGISRYALDCMLLEAASARGAEVWTGGTVVSLAPENRRFKILVRQGNECRTLEARSVIGAWGRNPRADLAGNSGRPRGRWFVGIKSHVTGIAREPAVELYFFKGGYLGISPVEDGRCNLAALFTLPAFHRAGKTVQGAIELAARRHPALGRRLAKAEPVPGTQLAAAPVAMNRKPAAWDGIPRIGDAAMMIPPLCGDGMAMALRSAELCAAGADQYLRGSISYGEWEAGYVDALRREITAPARWGRLLQSALTVPSAASLLLGLGRLSPDLAFRMVQRTRLQSDGQRL